MTSGRLGTLIRPNSEQNLLCYEDACYEEILNEEEVFFPPDFSAWLLQIIFTDSYIAACVVGHTM